MRESFIARARARARREMRRSLYAKSLREVVQYRALSPYARLYAKSPFLVRHLLSSGAS